jgi:signal transduction histidine kinase
MKFLPASGSISSKLARMNIAVSGTALLLACFAFFAYDLISFQKSLVHTLSAEARITGLNSVSAIMFNDRDSARATLDDLASSPDISSAAIVTNGGTVFAQFQRPNASAMSLPPLPPGVVQRSWTSGTHVLLAERILFQGKSVGIVYITARLRELGHRALQYFIIAVVILIFCLIAANLLTAAFRRLVAQQIVSLANMTLAVTRDRDYSLRAPPSREHDEIAVLIDAFNEMLTEIERRDTELRQARDELEQRVEERTSELRTANRELEAFSYTVAHDLRGPLDTIGSLAYLLGQKSESLDAEGQDMIGNLRHSSEKMRALVDDLLNLSRSGSAQIQRSTTDMSRIASDIAAELKASDPQRKAKFDIEPGAVVLADRGLMRVVVDNLMRNAWKYSSGQSMTCIEFAYYRSGHKTVFFVRDNGAGFNPEFADRLFRPFERLHTQTEFPGTGIGLATVQRIVARHGGEVWAEGSVGQGATFYFSLET